MILLTRPSVGNGTDLSLPSSGTAARAMKAKGAEAP